MKEIKGISRKDRKLLPDVAFVHPSSKHMCLSPRIKRNLELPVSKEEDNKCNESNLSEREAWERNKHYLFR